MIAYLVTGARPLGNDPADLLLADGVIAALGPDAAARAAQMETTGAVVRRLDATGLVALPGLVDLHTHLREPGGEESETIDSGTRAAALGGYTAVFAMPNTSPTQDTAEVVEYVARRGREAGHADVHPIGAVTVGREGVELADLTAMARSAARVRVFSDDGDCVADTLLMRRALETVLEFDGVIAQHAQEPRLTEGAQVHEGEVSAALGLVGWPAVAEEIIIARDCLLAEHLGARVHVCHLSTAGSVEIVRRAKERGIAVTAEVTPHHLLLTDEAARSGDPLFKVNPPLRTNADVEAVRAGLADGTIDIVGTDHAPQPEAKKRGPLSSAAFGMTGLETALSIVQQTMVDTGAMTWADVAQAMSETPARIGRIHESDRPQGRPLAIGEPANLTLYDPTARRVVDPAQQATSSTNSPYRGTELPGRVLATFLRGVPTVLQGRITTTAEREATA